VFQATARGGPLLFCVDINFRVALRGAAWAAGDDGATASSTGRIAGGTGLSVLAAQEAWGAAAARDEQATAEA
jgi:hypothetical protein